MEKLADINHQGGGGGPVFLHTHQNSCVGGKSDCMSSSACKQSVGGSISREGEVNEVNDSEQLQLRCHFFDPLFLLPIMLVPY